jgi:ubiquinone/menaquinone biosynthesis C-methylase UbiE
MTTTNDNDNDRGNNNNTKTTSRDGNFDHMADEYDAQAARIWKFHTKVVEQILQTGYLNADQTVLEFGCGTGNVCLSLCPQVRHVYGIDISSKMLEKAKGKIDAQQLSNASVHQLDLDRPSQLTEIGFPTHYDWIVCCMVLHHVPNPMEKLELLTSLLSPNDNTGRLVIVEFGVDSNKKDGGQHGHSHYHQHSHHHHHSSDREEDGHHPHDSGDAAATDHHHGHKAAADEGDHHRIHDAGNAKHPAVGHDHSHSHHGGGDEDAAGCSGNATPTKTPATTTNKEALMDKHGIFTDGFHPKSIQVALQTLGLTTFEMVELPPLEGMDSDHPFFGLPVAVMLASK